MCCIRLGGEQVEYFALTVNGRERPDSTDFWDANWLVCTVEVAAGAFHGRVDCSLRSDELDRFHHQVARLNERLDGAAELTTMEGWLTLQLTCDGRGHVEAKCRLCDDPAGGNTLECRLATGRSRSPKEDTQGAPWFTLDCVTPKKIQRAPRAARRPEQSKV